MYDTVLVPTDGSRLATTAAGHAVAVAARFDADLHALHVANPDADQAPGGGREATERVVDLAAERGVPAQGAVVEGAPADAILEYADDHGVDLVVMGTRGRSGLDRYLLGSVTESVVRRADVPVMTVRPSERAVDSGAVAQAIAGEALAAAGHDSVSFPEEPHRESSTWVVRATADGRPVNVHVDAGSGETTVAHLDGD